MGLKEEILDHFAGDFERFYRKYLPETQKASASQRKAICPFHKEEEPSLHFKPDTGEWYCHAEKEGGDIFIFYAKHKGLDYKADFPKVLLQVADDFGIDNGQPQKTPPPWERPAKETHDYHNESGEVIFKVIRFDDGLDPKFMQGRPKAKGGINWGLKGTKPVLYHLPEVLGAQEVLLVEGERDADNTKKLGLVVTTFPMGAISKEEQFQPQYAEALKDKDVILCGDNDDPGRKHVEVCARVLHGVARSVRILELPELPERGDISDWLKARQGELPKGATVADAIELIGEKLCLLIEKAEPYEPAAEKVEPEQLPTQPLTPAETCAVHCFQREPSPREYILEDILPARIVGGIVAKGGESKTQLLLQLGVGMAICKRMLGCFTPTIPLKVLGLFAEDPGSEIHRRFYSLGQGLALDGEDLEKIEKNLHVVSVMGQVGPLMKLSDGIPVPSAYYAWLKATIETHQGLDVLILDPKNRFYGLDENDNSHNSAWVACLEALVREYGITVLFSHHVSKASGGALDQMSARGGGALVDACRWVVNLKTMDEAAAKKFNIENRRAYVAFEITKSNYAPTLPGTLYFKRSEGGVLVPADLYGKRVKEMAGELSRLLFEAYAERAATYTRREITNTKQGAVIRGGLKITFDRCTRDELTRTLDYMLEEGAAEIRSMDRGGRRPADVVWIKGMENVKPEKVL